ncbi:MAG: hypothetical protein NTZ92_07965 [Candidatus Omnitrophica bacterium]|nr:hypothetical protein [Candidatus Omnitrophota bacterium]
MQRKYLMALLLSLLSFIIFGCTTMPTSQDEFKRNKTILSATYKDSQAKEVKMKSNTIKGESQEAVKYVANFNYTPDFQGAPGSTGVIFAIANLTYRTDDEKVLWFTYPQFINLGKSIKDDLPELLIAKGFSVQGPFDSLDLISYSDKKAIDLWLVPVMGLSITLKDRKAEVESIWAAPPVYILSGNAEVSGKINLELREVVTHELMWSKSIPFTNTFHYSLRIPGYRQIRQKVEGGTWTDVTPFDYALIMNDVAKEVEQQYPNLMATIAKLIEPEEMRIIKKQAQELKSKKGY